MNELKKELSKLTGIDMFNPRFREVFKKYFPDDKDAEDERFEAMEDFEDEKVLEDAGKVEPEEVKEEVKEEVAEEKPKVESAVIIPEKEPEEPKEEMPAEDKKEENLEQDIEKAEDEREIDKIEEEKAEEPAVAEEKKEELNEETKEIGEKVDEMKNEYADELYDAKLELALIKNKIREDRLDPAKKYIKSVLPNVEDLDKVDYVLKEFPEWVKRATHEERGFGMSVDEIGDGLTEEEKRLKAMGIDPRD